MFAKLLGEDQATLQEWLNGAIPDPTTFNMLVNRWLTSNLLDGETTGLLVNSYNRQAYPDYVEENQDQSAKLVDERFKIRRATPPHVLSSVPTFAAALEQVRVSRNLPWSVISAATGVSENTLRRWARGTLPRQSSLHGFLEMGTEHKLFSVGERTLLSESYNYDVERQVLYGVKTEVWTDPTLTARSDIGVTFDTNVSSVRLDIPAPPIPDQISPGPTLKPTSAGFDIAIHPPPEAEREDRELQRLHQQLRRLTERLAESMPRISNTHKELADEFAAYVEFLAPDLSDLDITSFWAVGTGLGAHIRALGRASPNVMTPELEPAIVARFETLMGVHAAFVLGFSAVREMQARIAQARAAAQDDPELPAQVQSVLDSMVRTPHLLADKARNLVVALVHGLPAAPDAAFDLLAGRYETAKNSTHAFMRALQPFIDVAGVVGLVSLGNAALSGEQVDLMLTTGTYIHAHMQDLMALYRNDQITTNWLRWAHQRLQRRDE